MLSYNSNYEVHTYLSTTDSAPIPFIHSDRHVLCNDHAVRALSTENIYFEVCSMYIGTVYTVHDDQV